jgi:YgiT-type zinc finger domain-containing protein
MTTDSSDPVDGVRRSLAAWHATHPRATFAEIEAAVEAELTALRAQLVEEQAGATYHEEHPACPRCGTTMVPRRRSTRTVITRGEDAVQLERAYVVCPACGAGLFPPG